MLAIRILISLFFAISGGLLCLRIMLGKNINPLTYFFKIDKKDAHGYKNLGIYHLENNEFKKALIAFKKAKSIDPATFQINELIEKAKLGKHNK